ncbi:MAG TPA: c-type cytochrome, partial [Rhodanobacteraceae bacterium]
SPSDPGIPRLAGKPAAYLVQQLHYFQTGQRRHAPMEYVVRQLSPAYLEKIADYFAAQDVPVHDYPIPAVTAAQLRRGKELVEHGDKALGVPSCQSCHGTKLTGVKPMIPGIVGVSYAYLHTQLKLWREQKRAGGGTFCMGVVANRLRESDIQAVSAWLAEQKPPADMQPVAADAHAQPLPGWCVVGDATGATP